MSLDLNKLKKMKNENINTIYLLEKKIRLLENFDKIVTKQIYQNCDHEWVKSNWDFGPYDKAPKICTKCNLEKDNFLLT